MLESEGQEVREANIKHEGPTPECAGMDLLWMWNEDVYPQQLSPGNPLDFENLELEATALLELPNRSNDFTANILASKCVKFSSKHNQYEVRKHSRKMDGSIHVKFGHHENYRGVFFGVVHAQDCYKKRTITGPKALHRKTTFEVVDASSIFRSIITADNGLIHGALVENCDQVTLRFLMTSSEEEEIGRKEAAREWKILFFPLEVEEYENIFKSAQPVQLKDETVKAAVEENMQVLAELRQDARSKKIKRLHMANGKRQVDEACDFVKKHFDDPRYSKIFLPLKQAMSQQH